MSWLSCVLLFDVMAVNGFLLQCVRRCTYEMLFCEPWICGKFPYPKSSRYVSKGGGRGGGVVGFSVHSLHCIFIDF